MATFFTCIMGIIIHLVKLNLLAIILKLVQECLFAYNWNLEMGKALNGSFDAGLFEFGLIMQISEGIDVVYGQNSKRI